MKQKIISVGVLLSFFLLFGYFFGEIYWDFQNQQRQEKVFQDHNIQSLEDFSLEALPLIGEEIKLFITPDLGLLDQIVSQIDAAQEKVYIEVYIFTEKRMREALIRAHNRGVDVKVLLENNPYQAPYLNDETFDLFETVGIDVRWSDPLLYSLNHTKLLFIDEEVYLSTGNFSYTLFKYNRDFLLRISHPTIVSKLQTLFFLDYEQEFGGVVDPHLLLSPHSGREKLQYLLSQAESTIDFYFPYLQDERLENILFEQASQGIEIRGIVSEEFYTENQDIVSKYKENNIELSALKTDKLHAKMILVDSTYAYVGSINFSSYSLDENREVGIIFQDKNIISALKNKFVSDLE